MLDFEGKLDTSDAQSRLYNINNVHEQTACVRQEWTAQQLEAWNAREDYTVGGVRFEKLGLFKGARKAQSIEKLWQWGWLNDTFVFVAHYMFRTVVRMGCASVLKTQVCPSAPGVLENPTEISGLCARY